MNKEHLLQVAKTWAEQTISDWINEYSAWDELVEEGVITDSELEWIQENVNFTIEVDEEPND